MTVCEQVKVTCPVCGYDWKTIVTEEYTCPDCESDFAGEDAIIDKQTWKEGKKHELESMSQDVGKEVYMEIRGGTPLVQGRREVAIKGRIIAVNESNTQRKTVTIEIPLGNIATICYAPIRSRKRNQPKKAGRE